MTPTSSENNRTGVSRDPDLSKDMMKGAKDTIDGTDVQQFLETRLVDMRHDVPVATMPPPAHPEKLGSAFLLDKLGERLAFERAGTRLYETLLAKLDANGGFPGGPTRDQLEKIRNDELSHFALLEGVIGRLGGDPTAVTPSANLVAVESRGLCATINDPRTTLAEGLHAILVAELTDNAGWEQLIDVVQELGETELAAWFREALTEEQEHLERVQMWLRADAVGRLDAGSPSSRDADLDRATPV
jgi:rubrerythrin